MDERWGNLARCYIHSKPSKSMDQNQQNFLKLTNPKKFGAILVGIFEFRTKSSKRRLEKGGGGSEMVINMAHDTKMMVSRDKLSLIQR